MPVAAIGQGPIQNLHLIWQQRKTPSRPRGQIKTSRWSYLVAPSQTTRPSARKALVPTVWRPGYHVLRRGNTSLIESKHKPSHHSQQDSSGISLSHWWHFSTNAPWHEKHPQKEAISDQTRAIYTVNVTSFSFKDKIRNLSSGTSPMNLFLDLCFVRIWTSRWFWELICANVEE